MRIVPINEVLGLGSGETVPCVKGTVKSVFDQNRGTNTHGDWRLQNVVISDGTGEIKVKLADRDPVPNNWKGKVVCFECNDGGKGLTGIKAKDDEYRGKITRILHVTPSAHMTLVEGNGGQTQQQPAQNTAPAQQQQAPPQQTQQTTQQQAPPSNGNGNGGNGHSSRGDAVSEAATRRARDYYRVMGAVQAMRQAWDKEHPQAMMSPDHFQAACSTVFIQLQRDGVINGH